MQTGKSMRRGPVRSGLISKCPCSSWRKSYMGQDCASIETSHAQRGGGTWTDGLDCIDIDSTVASAFNLVPMESPGAPRGQSHGSRTKGQQTRSLISSGACQERGSSPPATRRPSGHTSMRLKPMRHSY